MQILLMVDSTCRRWGWLLLGGLLGFGMPSGSGRWSNGYHAVRIAGIFVKGGNGEEEAPGMLGLVTCW